MMDPKLQHGSLSREDATALNQMGDVFEKTFKIPMPSTAMRAMIMAVAERNVEIAKKEGMT